MSRPNPPGRRASIPEWAFSEVFQLHGCGNGCRKIARLLEDKGIYTTKSSVDRLLRWLPPYDGMEPFDFD